MNIIVLSTRTIDHNTIAVQHKTLTISNPNIINLFAFDIPADIQDGVCQVRDGIDAVSGTYFHHIFGLFVHDLAAVAPQFVKGIIIQTDIQSVIF